MDKILSEHRRPIGNFEVVDIADSAVIDEMRGQVDIDVPVDLHWTWSYDSDMDELRRLYEKGKGGQWNAQTESRLVDSRRTNGLDAQSRSFNFGERGQNGGWRRGGSERSRFRRSKLLALAALAW